MDYIGGMLNPIGKMLKTHNKNEFGYGFTGKIMVYNVILMENIGISVMVSNGLLLFYFLTGMALIKACIICVHFSTVSVVTDFQIVSSCSQRLAFD